MPTIPMPALTSAPAHPSNYGVGRGGILPEALVLHIADGSEAAMRAWFQTPPEQRNPPVGASSAHYGVTTRGAIVQYVRPEDTAWSNGVLGNGWDGRAAAPLIRANQGVNPNSWCLSIEHEGRPGDPIPVAQWDASVRLAAALCANYLLPHAADTGFKIDRSRILLHSDFDPVNRGRCPGWSEDMVQRYIADVRKLVETAANPHQPTLTPATPTTHNPVDELMLRAGMAARLAEAVTVLLDMRTPGAAAGQRAQLALHEVQKTLNVIAGAGKG